MFRVAYLPPTIFLCTRRFLAHCDLVIFISLFVALNKDKVVMHL